MKAEFIINTVLKGDGGNGEEFQLVLRPESDLDSYGLKKFMAQRDHLVHISDDKGCLELDVRHLQR